MREHTKLVRRHFEFKYKNYDRKIVKLIPRYNEMHRKVVDSIDCGKTAAPKILDLGFGTGQTASLILEKFPAARIDGFDMTSRMLDEARKRLSGQMSKVRLFEEDVSAADFDKGYDSALSVLCIHHLESDQKRKLFKKIFDSLNDGGTFVIADIVVSEVFEETVERENEWRGFLIKTFGTQDANFWFDNYREEDFPETVKDHIDWLKNAGFREVSCVWQCMNYAVIVARK